MSIETHFLVLIIMWLQFWNLKAFSFFTETSLMIGLFLWMGIGHFLYRNKTKNRIDKHTKHEKKKKRRELAPFLLIATGIALSTIPAYLYHGQSFIQSLITYRVNYLWIIIPYLLSIKIREEQIVKTLVKVSILMLSVYFLMSEDLSLFYVSEEFEEQLEETGRIGYIHGFTLAAIPICYYLDRIKKEFKPQYLFPIILCCTFLVLSNNRSTLIPVSIIILWHSIMSKSNYKYLFIILFITIAAYNITSITEYWTEMFGRTVEDVNNTDYARNKAYFYFIYEANEHVLNYFLGNGFLSANATSLMEDLRTLGIYNSDLGFIGYWNQYGIFPIIAFLYILIHSLLKKHSITVKNLAFVILAGSLTTSYYGEKSQILFFSIFYILYVLSSRELDERNVPTTSLSKE